MKNPTSPVSFVHGVVVCTRNRPDDVRRLIRSLEKQICTHPFLVVVVDASDPELVPQVRDAASVAPSVPVRFVTHAGLPSSARQRNDGVGLLPEEISIVHFLDDDVELEADYLEVLTSILASRPDVAGAGGRVLLPNEDHRRAKWKHLIARVFLLESSKPGKVLPSGGMTSAQLVPLTDTLEVEFLGGCSATFRREVVRTLRFDDRLDGHSIDEDLDLSYRASKLGKLVVDPRARLLHHLSAGNRQSVREERRDALVHRYWFVEKNLRHPFRKPAFWWKTIGSYLITSLSRNPDAREASKGIVDGAFAVLRRSHPLLKASEK